MAKREERRADPHTGGPAPSFSHPVVASSGRHIDAIGKIAYLSLLPPAEREWLSRDCEIRCVARGATAFGEGDKPSGIFLILAGRVKIMRSRPDGREQVLHQDGPGATLGEVPVFDGGGYLGSAVAVEDATLLFVPRLPLLTVLGRNPASSAELIRILANRVRHFAALIEDLSMRTVPARLAGYLLRESTRTGSPTIELPATRDDLAAHIGTVREQASRALSQLTRAGIIDVERQRLRILDPARLRARAMS
jgi:CRP-like cAMP-binding protein